MARQKGKKENNPLVKEAETLHLEQLEWDGLTWLNIEEPTERETAYLAERYPFHPLDLDDCLSKIQRPKIDEYKDYLFLVLHFPVYNRELRVTTTSQVSVFIGQNYIITLHKGDFKTLVKLFRECQIDEEARQENFNKGGGYLLYRMVDRLVDYCLPILNKIGDNIERAEDNIFERRGMSRAIEDISMLRRDIIAFRRIIWPMRAVLGNLEPKIRRFTTMELSVYFGDMVDHVDKIWDGLDEYKEIIEGLNDTHDSLASNRINDVLRVLTILATISAVLTVISSFYGMNVALPGGGDPAGSSYTWIWLLVSMLAAMGGLLFYFYHKRWF
ncbi:MAG: magnesium transporter CorA family protein [Dehalococcoidales bacterium]|jgi:magnesium transporter